MVKLINKMILQGLFFKTILAYFHLRNFQTDTISTPKCPIITLQTNPPVNITEYVRKSWYVQQQQVNGYQQPDDLYCVAATYDIDNKTTVPFFRGKVISVYNYANYKKVNGLPMGVNQKLCARETNISQPEKLLVSPCFLPNIFGGPYWILAVGPKSDNYEWAIVIGGQPRVRTSNTTCTTSETNINNSGLWLFSRSPKLEENKLNFLRNKLVNHNISLSKLLNVSQKGCNYTNAFLK
jgi:lipocalin